MQGPEKQGPNSKNAHLGGWTIPCVKQATQLGSISCQPIIVLTSGWASRHLMKNSGNFTHCLRHNSPAHQMYLHGAWCGCKLFEMIAAELMVDRVGAEITNTKSQTTQRDVHTTAHRHTHDTCRHTQIHGPLHTASRKLKTTQNRLCCRILR